MKNFVKRVRYILRFTCLFSLRAAAQSDASLADLTLEQLINIEVTSASPRAQPLLQAATSMFVITSEDIRRNGARSIPEALRLAPNLQVARVSASEYAITSRGFNNSAGNKLLVLIDGRSVYSPLFSGVFWDVQEVVMEDVERIEVISGPGGTLWGTNAVNGIINVITRQSSETQGLLASAGVGTDESQLALRHGGELGSNGHFRIFGKYLDRDRTRSAFGGHRNDSWHHGQLGFRADWLAGSDSYQLQGDIYDGGVGQPAPGVIVTGVPFPLGRIDVSGGSLSGRWDRDLAAGGGLFLQAYYDRTWRRVPPTFAENVEIIDLQIQHAMPAVQGHSLAWGAEYRYAASRIENSEFIAFLPGNRNLRWFSLYAQDEYSVTEDLRLTLGTRIERNDYTDFEFLPSLRAAWNPGSGNLWWSGVSRAVRSPSRVDTDAHIPGEPPFLLDGGPAVRSEIATVYELGYRGQPWEGVSFSATLFYSEYDHLRSQELAPSGTFLVFASGAEGSVRGVETWGSYQVNSDWRVSVGLSALDMDLQLKAGSNDPVGPQVLGNDPEFQWTVRSSLDLTPELEMDFSVRRVGPLPAPRVEAYTAVNARLGWQPAPSFEISLIVDNLFNEHKPEFAVINEQSELGRAVYFKLVFGLH